MMSSEKSRTADKAEPAAGAEKGGPARSSVSDIAVQEWLIARIAQELHIDPSKLTPDLPVLAAGVDSMQVISLIADLENHLSIRFTSNPLDDFPTIEQLSQFAAGLAANRSSE